MTYVLNGSPSQATTPEALVAEMRDQSFTPSPSVEVFMVATAARVAEQFGTEVRSSTAAAFVADLIKVGIVEEVKS